MLTEFFLITLIGTLTCVGAYAVSITEGNPLFLLRKFLKNRTDRGLLKKWIAKPLLLCDLCMTSVWGTGVYLLFFQLKWWYFKLYVPYLFCVAAGVYILWTVLSTFRAIRDSYANPAGTSSQHPKPVCRTHRDGRYPPQSKVHR